MPGFAAFPLECLSTAEGALPQTDTDTDVMTHFPADAACNLAARATHYARDGQGSGRKDTAVQ